MHLYFFSKIKIYIHRLLYHIEHQCAVRTECASERAWRHAVRVGRALEFDTQPPSVFCLWCASLQHELPSPTTCWEIRVRIHMVSLSGVFCWTAEVCCWFMSVLLFFSTRNFSVPLVFTHWRVLECSCMWLLVCATVEGGIMTLYWCYGENKWL